MSKDLDKIIAGLKHWNLKLKNPKYDRNFQSRLVIQKLAFLCQVLGIKSRYHFTLYKNGPYSPDLTQDYYEAAIQVANLETSYQPTTEDKEVYEKIEKHVLLHPLNKDYQAEYLEAVSTVYYLKHFNSDYLDDDLFEKTKEEKPFIRDNIIVVAINTVKKLMFKPEYLTKEIQDEMDLWDKADD